MTIWPLDQASERENRKKPVAYYLKYPKYAEKGTDFRADGKYMGTTMLIDSLFGKK